MARRAITPFVPLLVALAAALLGLLAVAPSFADDGGVAPVDGPVTSAPAPSATTDPPAGVPGQPGTTPPTTATPSRTPHGGPITVPSEVEPSSSSPSPQGPRQPPQPGPRDCAGCMEPTG
jgi:hypothetical protein